MDWATYLKRADPLLDNSHQQGQILDLVSAEAELLDPNPDLHEMFQLFDLQFFDGKLGCCLVEWSKRMKSAAGLCYYHQNSGLCTIRLSEPLLKLRPRRDFVQTLLHEMIHAYLFVTERYSDHDGHGENFQAHMHRINRMANTQISIYHSFNAEVALYRRLRKPPNKQDLSIGPIRTTCQFPSTSRTTFQFPSTSRTGLTVAKSPSKSTFQFTLTSKTGSITAKSPSKSTFQSPSTSKANPTTAKSLSKFQPASNFFVKCPVCSKLVTVAEMNQHLNKCAI